MKDVGNTQSIFKKINTMDGLYSSTDAKKYDDNLFIISTNDTTAENEKKKETEFHKVLKELCIENDKTNPRPEKNNLLKNWTHLKKYEKLTNNGSLICRLYKNHNTLVIVFKIQNDKYSIFDVKNHFSKGYGLPQFKEAVDYISFIKKEFQNTTIYLSGYNFGGSAAQFAALYYRDCISVTFNALGISDIFKNKAVNLDLINIINYVSSAADKRLRSGQIGILRMIFISDWLVMNIKPEKQHQLNDFDNLQYFRSGCNSQA